MGARKAHHASRIRSLGAAAASNPADATEKVGWRIHSNRTVSRLGACARRARTVATILAVAYGSCGGRGFSARATRLISSSCSSIMLLYLGQSRAHGIAGTLDPHAQRRKANTRQRRYVLRMKDLRRATQQKRFPLLRRKRNPAPLVLPRPSQRRTLPPMMTPPLPAHHRTRSVHGDASPATSASGTCWPGIRNSWRQTGRLREIWEAVVHSRTNASCTASSAS